MGVHAYIQWAHYVCASWGEVRARVHARGHTQREREKDECVCGRCTALSPSLSRGHHRSSSRTDENKRNEWNKAGNHLLAFLFECFQVSACVVLFLANGKHSCLGRALGIPQGAQLVVFPSSEAFLVLLQPNIRFVLFLLFAGKVLQWMFLFLLLVAVTPDSSPSTAVEIKICEWTPTHQNAPSLLFIGAWKDMCVWWCIVHMFLWVYILLQA
ncbi:hypothetical protein MOQ_007077 [Trypanosoma cruzi marinkellei]|uniref:Uncharacterized protein n=1 Tax=Trypanosoma cruzi marinkellei TaxID=85056 RepID=K2MTZ9_TRYCR|nr:hypothetical protein MOQ_007077 [Trypanosoma cruzi marinkellei]